MKFKGYPLDQYPDPGIVEFPEVLHIAFAVCGRGCGNREFIVDGQTQVCQKCGRLMFRTEIRRYRISQDVEG